MLQTNLKNLYTSPNLDYQKNRYNKLMSFYIDNFRSDKLRFFSTPGRTEICGNHTDHNNGKVIAASINLDSIAAVSKNDINRVIIHSQGFETPFKVDLSTLEVRSSEIGTTNALIRGIAARFRQEGYKIGGFNAVITSNVLQGSGLSSSASIEVLIGTIFNALYNEGLISSKKIAEISQFAENKYFGKPCGLMDQMACAVGNIISIDFKDPKHGVVTPLDFNFSKIDYSLVIIDTGGNHADLTDDYASVPKEMKEVAQYFGKDVCREISEQDFFDALPILRTNLNHRAILRCFHFINENKRVDQMVEALQQNDFQQFLTIMKASGNSSYKYLQNIFTNKAPHDQGISLALALVENYLSGISDGACRVHGGGFAGTIQAFIPNKNIDRFISTYSNIFGKNSIQVLNIRPYGSVEVAL